MKAFDNCTVGGSAVRTRTNEFQLASKGYVGADERQRPTDRGRLVVRKGLGLAKNCVLQPHFSEFGLFPRLLEAMNLTRSRFGIGIDEPICLELPGGSKAEVRGRGRPYFFVRHAGRRGSTGIRVRIYGPGSRFELRA